MKRVIKETIEVSDIFKERAREGKLPMIRYSPRSHVAHITIRQVWERLDRPTIILEIERTEKL